MVDPGVRNGDVWFLPTNIVQDLTKGLKGCPKRDPKRAKNGGFQGPKPWISGSQEVIRGPKHVDLLTSRGPKPWISGSQEVVRGPKHVDLLTSRGHESRGPEVQRSRYP